MTRPTPITTTSPAKGEAEKARFIKILEATTDVVAMMDRSGRLLYLNIAGRRLFGWNDTDEATTHSFEEIHPPWAYELIRHESIPTAIDIGCWSGESALKSASGVEIPILQVILAHTDPSGEVEFLSTICRDISDRKEKELEQIEWANRYDAAIRASGQVLFDWDSTTGAITYGGDVEQLLGYPSETMAGGLARLKQIVAPEDLPAFEAAIDSVLLTRDPFRHEFRVRRRNGNEIIVNAQGFFFLDRLGRIGRMVGFLKDVTIERTAESAIQLANERLEHRVAERTKALERAAVELQDNARQQEAVAKLGQMALAGLDVSNLMQEAAETVCTVLRVEMSSVLEYLPEESVFKVRAQSGWPSPENPPCIQGGTRSQSGYALLTGQAIVSKDFSAEDRFTISESVVQAACRSGVSVSIQAGDRPLGVLCAFSTSVRDYGSDEVSFLQSVANVLSSAIERNRVEEDARDALLQAETANRAKSEFLSRMSHELRTPLNAILGFTQLLELENHTPAQAESIEHISRAGKNLLNLINEVLDIARVEAGRMLFQIETVNIDELLQEAAQLSMPVANRLGISISAAHDSARDAFAACDPARLKQIFLNLISNAVKYNRDGGSVTMVVKLAPDGCWRISIIDTGNGLTQEQLGRLFVPFERLGAQGGGTGLGLALSTRLAGAMNGRIGAESTVGVGSTFWVEIPAAPAPQVQTPPVPSAPPPADTPASALPRRKKLLYIEDDLANFYLLERIISAREHVELVSAIQASIGIDLAREHQPDAILLDLNLPDMTGEQVLKILKNDANTASIPVIVVTGGVVTERPDLTEDLGVVEILGKPYRVQELLAILDRVLA